MGQGTESCQGYEFDYDPYEEGMESGEWTTKGGSTIKVTDMTISHLRGARRVAQNAAAHACFTNETEKWNDWVQIFDDELERRPEPPPKAPKLPAKPPRGKMVDMICHCKHEYKARQADLKRGQGLSCGKRCAAIRREFGRPPAKRKVV